MIALLKEKGIGGIAFVNLNNAPAARRAIDDSAWTHNVRRHTTRKRFRRACRMRRRQQAAIAAKEPPTVQTLWAEMQARRRTRK